VTITAYSQTRFGNVTQVTATSDLVGGPVYYHWYSDGCWCGASTAPTWSAFVPDDEQARLECVDTLDPDYDPLAAPPAGWPARRTLYWVRSLGDVDHYRVEQSQDGGAYEVLARVPAEPTRWDYTFLTGRLDDLSDYTWRIVPVDAIGNDGPPLTIGPERIVRTPDAPAAEIVWNEAEETATICAF
jgi:hypothetical protein